MTLPPEPLVDALRAALSPAYDLESELSGGGMSRVFVATERALNRKVVVKVLPPDVAAGVNRDRFRREIQLAAQLQHPHIVPLLSAGDTEGVLYYTMPFIEGESLKHALAHGTRFTPREVIGILLDVVDALAHAHSRGVIHRDIKPANVLRSGTHAVVADFGVAKAISAALPAVGMTTSGMAIGTPQYMAPEQLAGDPAADHRMDIYAVGLLGYELLTGTPTFAEHSPQATLAAQLTRNPAPIELKRPDVPNGLATLLMQCLAKEPGNRPPTAQAVRAELEEIVMPSGDYTPSRLLPRRKKRNRAVPIGIAAIVLAAAGLLVARQLTDGEAPTTAEPGTTSVAPPATADSTSVSPTPPPAAGGSGSNTPAVTSTAPPPSKADSSGGRQAVAASAPGTAPTTPVTPPRRPAPRTRTAADSIADLVLLLKAQAPADPIVRRPQPNEVSQAGIEERRNNPGPRRKAVVFADTGALSRAMAERVGRTLDQSRFDVTISDRQVGVANQGFLDTLAMSTDHDVVIAAQAIMRRDSSFTGLIRLRDLTAHQAYANGSASRRLPKDSVQLNIDSLASSAVRRLTQMDRAPRAGAIDPELRAFDERAANMGPPRRLVIWNHPPHDNLRVQVGGTAVMDVLRTAVRSLPRFVPVPRDSTHDLLSRSRNRETVMNALQAELMVSIAASLSSSRADSVSWVISVRDLGAQQQYQERSFRTAAAPLDNPLAFSAIALARVLAALEQIDAAPRRR
jgi:serine/threonine protein kinase